jgi:guanosine-3',5'-bis(diphosphate) 3'-pyrophosphohydrolase
MSTSTDILSALQFASNKHRDGRRKNKEKTPYINHPIAVAHLLATVAGVSDHPTLIAAVLHDTIEDTETTREELDATFGAEIRQLVEEVTDDKTLEKHVRKQLQIEHAPELSRRAKLIKLADLTCNLTDILDDPPPWPPERRVSYLEWTEQVIAGCRGTNEKLEQHYDRLVARGRLALHGD